MRMKLSDGFLVCLVEIYYFCRIKRGLESGLTVNALIVRTQHNEISIAHIFGLLRDAALRSCGRYGCVQELGGLEDRAVGCQICGQGF